MLALDRSDNTRDGYSLNFKLRKETRKTATISRGCGFSLYTVYKCSFGLRLKLSLANCGASLIL